METKTNALRLTEAAGIDVKLVEYATDDGAIDGVSVAKKTGRAPETVFKTLVTRGAKGGIYVFAVPVEATLDLKKAAKAVGEKSIAMIKQNELLPLTGYIHGGCSPVGMKKKYPTVIDETALLIDDIAVSAGRVGLQMILDPEKLRELTDARFIDIT